MLTLSCYLVLLFCDAVGLSASLIVHVSIICGFPLPPEILIEIINKGLLILLFLRLLISQRIKKGLKLQEIMKLVFNSCPKWLRITAGILIIYGICISIVSLFGAFHLAFSSHVADTKENIEIMRSRFYIGLSALWILIYSYEFAASYCYRRLWKKRVQDDISDLSVGNVNINSN